MPACNHKQSDVRRHWRGNGQTRFCILHQLLLSCMARSGVVSHADTSNFALSVCLLLDPKLSWDSSNYMDTHGYRRRPCCWAWGSTTLSFRYEGSGALLHLWWRALAHYTSFTWVVGVGKGREKRGVGRERVWKLELDLAIWNFSPQVGNSRIASNSWCKDLCWSMTTFRIPSIYSWPRKDRFTSKSYL